jgi:hypothetical protein
MMKITIKSKNQKKNFKIHLFFTFTSKSMESRTKIDILNNQATQSVSILNSAFNSVQV